ncbi:hypothetical protein O1611_g8386 [Lasiodiplodia mahajangana]|uniref:Uncharacterized protein n=1 Tax=Lasiodiplodia mahajangana TaxID=1108764 RepID=A0ACC2JCN9_9PEZI|nr:hypothetical protein O1611_g8386 [Lasiodiplodia mahajangana]
MARCRLNITTAAPDSSTGARGNCGDDGERVEKRERELGPADRVGRSSSSSSSRSSSQQQRGGGRVQGTDDQTQSSPTSPPHSGRGGLCGSVLRSCVFSPDVNWRMANGGEESAEKNWWYLRSDGANGRFSCVDTSMCGNVDLVPRRLQSTAAMTSETPMEDAIRTKVTEALSPSRLEIFNDSHKHAHHKAMQGSTSRETHFRVVITSEAFRSKMQPARHRLVYGLLRNEMAAEGGIHACSYGL